ncbi:hypothetical protein, partial [Lactococcus petauri]|uniref:hypothetical protein n=1 Tax=Lactococcus petauri TaxID=1940789 RepID=UPI0032B433A8
AIVVNAQQHSVNHFGYSKGSIDLGAGKSISQAFDLTTSANRIAVQPFTDAGFVEPISVVLCAGLLFFILRFAYRKFQNMNKKGL